MGDLKTRYGYLVGRHFQNTLRILQKFPKTRSGNQNKERKLQKCTQMSKMLTFPTVPGDSAGTSRSDDMSLARLPLPLSRSSKLVSASKHFLVVPLFLIHCNHCASFGGQYRVRVEKDSYLIAKKNFRCISPLKLSIQQNI